MLINDIKIIFLILNNVSMKLLSIDVGIKNLAYCLIESNANANANDIYRQNIIKWDVINLCGQDPLCSKECNKVAKFAYTPIKNQEPSYFCLTHAKKSDLIMPTSGISLKKLKKMKMADLHKLVSEYTIPMLSNSVKKDDILKSIIEFMDTKMLISVSNLKANDMDLVMLGIAMRKAFDTELKSHIETIDCIVIENQISPIANRMKTLQGMIAQYFIMHDKTQILFVSAANKLKGHVDLFETDISTYAARKKEGINVTLNLINENHKEWLTHFKTHKKKDDLADSYLQGIWYLNSVKNK